MICEAHFAEEVVMRICRKSLVGAALLVSLVVTLALLTFGAVDAAAPLDSPLPEPPTNDSFANATAIHIPPDTLPYLDGVDLTSASVEYGEPSPCTGFSRTVWYKLTVETPMLLRSAFYPDPYVGDVAWNVYQQTGDSIYSLSHIACSNWYGAFDFVVYPGNTYYIQGGTMWSMDPAWLHLVLEAGPPPQIGYFYWYPWDPSTYDEVQFEAYAYDPLQLTYEWSFGDGATAQSQYPQHKYAADGTYLVQLRVTAPDGRYAMEDRFITVETHDVAITKFLVPKSGVVNKTSQITVGVRTKIKPEHVRVELYRVDRYGNWYLAFGSSAQYVPNFKKGSQTVDFVFNYTFSPSDLPLGTVTFAARASIDGYRDANEADNAAMSLPIPVKPGKGAVAAAEVTGAAAEVTGVAEVETMSGFTYVEPNHLSFLPLLNR